MSFSQVVVTLGSSRNIFGLKKKEKKSKKELLEKDVRNSNDFLKVFNYPSEERERNGMKKNFLPFVLDTRCFLG